MSKKPKRVNAVCSEEQYARYQDACRKRGVELNRVDQNHWMFNDAESGKRLMNYFYRSGTCCGVNGKGFRVCDIHAAIDLAPTLKEPTKPREKSKPPKEPRTSWPNLPAYQRSSVWKQKREDAFTHHGRKCGDCESTENLRVVRLTYLRPYGQEDPATDLKVQCSYCWDEERNPGSDRISKQFRQIVRQ